MSRRTPRAIRALSAAALALVLAACGGGGSGEGGASSGAPAPGAPAPGAPAPDTGGGGPASGALSVMSYNMHWGGPSGGRLAEVADIIAASGADVVGLQEVRRFARVQEGGDYGCQDQPALLAEMLSARTGDGWQWAFAANRSGPQSSKHCEAVTDEPRAEGVAIVSRYPIRARAAHRLPYDRGAAEARVDTPIGPVAVLTAHLHSTSQGARVAQARTLVELVRGREGTLVLTGDMNGQPDSEQVGILLSVTRDAWADGGVGDGRTRIGRIDYVLYRGAEVESARVVPRTVSDHRPVMARFRR